MHGGHNINLVFERLLEISEDLERLDGRVGVQGVAPRLDLQGSRALGCEGLQELGVGCQEVVLEALGEPIAQVLMQG